ncbi:hypothetical protein [Staphylococcus epidermidis]
MVNSVVPQKVEYKVTNIGKH